MARSQYSNTVSVTTRAAIVAVSSLTLTNFRAFRGSHQFEFEGKNVLVFGENGSGKTSLWSALDLFLDSVLAKDEATSRRDFGKHRYQFGKEAGEVRAEFLGTGGTKFREAIWSRDESPFALEELQSAARISARLDYRALWETYFLRRNKRDVDIWPLLIEVLIPHVSSTSGSTFGEMWEQIKFWIANPPKQDWLRGDLLGVLVDDLTLLLETIKEEAQKILDVIAPGLTFGIHFRRSRWVRAHRGPIYLRPPVISISASINGNQLQNHHNLLNEARLSALALSIYLAAAKINAAQARSSFKILALDDVLIGLDMSNRLPVLEVLETYFSDWQIFLFTYDRAWYELAKSRLGKERWKHFEFYAGGEVPVWGEDCGALEKSKAYLKAAQDLKVPDYKAAGVWARSAFEWMMKWFCDKHAISIPYCLDDKFLKAETLWQALQKVEVETIEKPGSPVEKRLLISEEIGQGVTRCKAQHLNPLCHANLQSFQPVEIEQSINALVALETELRGPFHSVSLPDKAAPPPPEKKIMDFDIENLPTKVQEAVYQRAGRALGKIPVKPKKQA